MEKSVIDERLDKLLDTTISNYYDQVNPDDEIDLYDCMFEHLINGDLDNAFYCPKLDDKTSEERRKTFALAREYSYLCFFDGNYSYWPDSIEGVGILDLGTLSKQILDNYNFLLELALENGKDSLDELAIFQQSDMATESAVIDYMRNTFGNDEALKKSLQETSKKDGMYSGLSNHDKYILYIFPQGVLYSDRGELEMNSQEYLLNQIAKQLEDDSIKSMESLAYVKDYLGNYYFENAIRDIHLDYLDQIEFSTTNDIEKTSFKK